LHRRLRIWPKSWDPPGLNLLFHIPLLLASPPALDVLIVLALQGRGFRLIEAS